MKWIGQNIYDFISRFRNDVYLESISSGTIASGGNLGLDSNNKIVKATAADGDITGVTAGTGLSGGGTSGTVTLNVSGLTVSEIAAGSILIAGETFADNDTSLMSAAAINDRIESFGYTTNTGDITGVDLTGSSPITINSETGTTSGNYSATIEVDGASTSARGVVELATTAETTTGTDAARAVTPDGLKDGYQGSTNVTTLGTIGTGVWRGTAIEIESSKHLVHYDFQGYGTGDGTNFEISKQVSVNTAPFNHDTSIGSDGLTAQTVQTWIRAGGKAMPKACTLKRITGWSTAAGSSTANIGLFKLTPVRDDNSNRSAVELADISYTAMGNAKMEDHDVTSFTATAIAAGDILFTALKAESGAIQYFSLTVEVEF